MIFGFQPALVFAEKFTQPVLSEFLEISYAMYYPIILVVCVYYFWYRYKEFEKCCFIVTASFFTYYLIFDFIPVAGPMYYYPAIGMENVGSLRISMATNGLQALSQAHMSASPS